eukprot:CAMPEP_0167758250 /NCGR_PEP_ID=MMETSP0110_2-20121227/10366_1 /TAXON_ID=629695 /ORGANISM="Gymnochlora sp., Strain CCMP2014" /LENGTH=193 /DNA_ID=CAMNT_0007644509 /DNA_START=60 /DNA_END=641 /DNA_ORIENTATION=+
MTTQKEKKGDVPKTANYPPYTQPPQLAYGWFCPHPPPYGPYFWPALPPGYKLVPVDKGNNSKPSNSRAESAALRNVARPTNPAAPPLATQMPPTITANQIQKQMTTQVQAAQRITPTVTQIPGAAPTQPAKAERIHQLTPENIPQASAVWLTGFPPAPVAQPRLAATGQALKRHAPILDGAARSVKRKVDKLG